MPDEKTIQLRSDSSAATEAWGEMIGERLKGGEVIELLSDLGGGKTTFVRGLARGAGSWERVTSPTFTISREYTTPSFVIMHFDFYRLAEAGIIADELRDYINSSQYVVIIEWGEIVQAALPSERISIAINQAGGDSRDIIYRYPSNYAYLFTGASS